MYLFIIFLLSIYLFIYSKHLFFCLCIYLLMSLNDCFIYLLSVCFIDWLIAFIYWLNLIIYHLFSQRFFLLFFTINCQRVCPKWGMKSSSEKSSLWRLHGRSLVQIIFQKNWKFMEYNINHLLQRILIEVNALYHIHLLLFWNFDLNEWPSVQPPNREYPLHSCVIANKRGHSRSIPHSITDLYTLGEFRSVVKDTKSNTKHFTKSISIHSDYQSVHFW